jgi:hypothetical protein
MATDDPRGYDLLDRLAEEFAARFRGGERPSLKEYIDRYPALADDIRDLFPALLKVEQVEEICQDRDEAERARTAFPPLSQVGDYLIVREMHGGGLRGRAGLARPPCGAEGAAVATGPRRHVAGTVP